MKDEQMAYFESGAQIYLNDIAAFDGSLYRVVSIRLPVGPQYRSPNAYVEFKAIDGSMPNELDYDLRELEDKARDKSFVLYNRAAIV